MDYSDAYPQTTGELIKFLQELPADTPVYISAHDGGWEAVEAFFEDGIAYLS